MLFMVNETWPSKSSVDVGKKSVELEGRERPPYLKSLGPYVGVGGDGIKSCVIYEIEKGHEEEGLKEIVGLFAQLLSIEGYKFTIEPVFTMEEALAFVGLQL
jgi:hypothetical protein